MSDHRLLRRLPLAVFTHQFELLLAIMCLLAGMAVFDKKAPPPGSIEESLPPAMIAAWQTMLLLGGALVIFGLLRRPGSTLERAGLQLLAPAATVYAISIITTVGARGVFAASITLAFGLACWARLYALGLYGRIVREREIDSEAR